MTGGDKRGNGDVTFRKFDQGDLPSCAVLAKKAWPYQRTEPSFEDEMAAMTAYVESARLQSNHGEVAVVSGNVVGILFARIDKDWTRLASFKMLCGECAMLVRALVDGTARAMLSPGLIHSLLMTETKLALLRPETDAEIELLIVDSDSRGKGIGKALVERFFDVARRKGCRRVTVYTEDKSSNWGFYERMGFEKCGTFYDNLASYYDNVHSTGMIYRYDL